MGRGDLAKVRAKNERIKKKRLRDKQTAVAKGIEKGKAKGEAQKAPAPTGAH
jgi:hypothetical protein